MKQTSSKHKGQLAENRVPARKPATARGKPREPDVAATSSADSASADPNTRHRPLDQPVGQVTRHI